MTKRWSNRPPGSNWGDFGEFDQIGRLNLITPQRRLAAFAEVKQGQAFCLSLPLDFPGGKLQPSYREPPRLGSTFERNIALADLFKADGAIDIGNDDYVTLHLQYSTQWDSLAHMGALFDVEGNGRLEKVFYNGYRADDVIRTRGDEADGARVLGIETMAQTCVQGRGVLVNLQAVFGRQKALVGHDVLMSVLDEQRISVETGDILCLYTGYGEALLAMNKEPDVSYLENSFADLDGNDARLLRWISDSGIAAICADNSAVEAKPLKHSDGSACCAPGTPFLPLHHHCLFKLGLPLGELWYFKELADALQSSGRSRFLLTAPPLRLPGAVGSPVTPVGTV